MAIQNTIYIHLHFCITERIMLQKMVKVKNYLSLLSFLSLSLTHLFLVYFYISY